MHSSILFLLSLPLLALTAPTPYPFPATSNCTPATAIPERIQGFYLQVDGSAEGQPELQIAWERPQNPKSPGHFILSDTPMTSPLLDFLNGNNGGKLCNQGDLCSNLDARSGKDQFQGFSFNGGDQNAKPAFMVVPICSSEGEPVYALKPRSDSGYESFAVTSFATGSQVMLRKKGQVLIGSNVTLKIMKAS
ncbi:MAG: hypothetical protein Q9187_005111 [Circinaria calcarea]